MPFAFSTLGCPDLALDEVLALATSRAVDGLELRAAPDAIVDVGTDLGARHAARTACEDADVRVLTVASYLGVCDPGEDDAFLASAVDHLRLAADLGAAYLRVFPGRDGAGPDGDVRAVRRLTALTPHAQEHGVRIAVETHDSHPRGVDVAAILQQLDQRIPDHHVEVIWDVLHPWRAGEDPAATLRAVAPWLAYVQMKDADAGPEGALRGVGAGQVPLDVIAALLADRPGLWWSLEWEKLWQPQLAELPDALGDALAWYRHTVVRGDGPADAPSR